MTEKGRRIYVMIHCTISLLTEIVCPVEIMSQGTTSQLTENVRSVEIMSQGTTSQLTENVRSVEIMSQGTTSVVPIRPQKTLGFSPCARQTPDSVAKPPSIGSDLRSPTPSPCLYSLTNTPVAV
jgi:hypothetical protein